MARFSVQVQSATALGLDTGFAWLMAPAGSGFKLRRVTVGVVAGAAAPSSQQVVIGINRVTTAGATPTVGMTPGKLDPNSPPAAVVLNTAYATAPAVTATDQFRITFNTQSGADLFWELPDDFVVAFGVANGLGFINRNNALPAAHAYVITAEFEE